MGSLSKNATETIVSSFSDAYKTSVPQVSVFLELVDTEQKKDLFTALLPVLMENRAKKKLRVSSKEFIGLFSESQAFADTQIELNLKIISERFRNLLDEGEEVKIKSFLALVDGQHRRKLFSLLLKQEIRAKQEAGEVVDPNQYKRFGTLGVKLAEKLTSQIKKLTLEKKFDSKLTIKEISDEKVNPYMVTSELQKEISDSKEQNVSPETPAIAGDGAHTIAPTNQSLGARMIGRYKLIEILGQGGMGSVWLAEQARPVKRKVALKVIRNEYSSSQAVARFEAERQALALMSHPNIAGVLDAGTTDEGLPFYVMELVEGQPISQYADKFKLTIPERIKLLIQVCRGIQHAHSKNVLHRDIKPDNILVTTFDGNATPKIIDFGLARTTESNLVLTEKTLATSVGQVVGTPYYMSPEQADMGSTEVDQRTDVYALGVILFELVTGTTPINTKSLEEKSLLQTLMLVRNFEPPSILTTVDTLEDVEALAKCRGCSESEFRNTDFSQLDQIFGAACANNPDDRIQSVEELGTQLRGCLTELSRPMDKTKNKKKTRTNRSQKNQTPAKAKPNQQLENQKKSEQPIQSDAHGEHREHNHNQNISDAKDDSSNSNSRVKFLFVFVIVVLAAIATFFAGLKYFEANPGAGVKDSQQNEIDSNLKTMEPEKVGE